MSDSTDDTDTRLGPLMEYFGERMDRTFAYFSCILEFENDEDLPADPTSNFRAWRLQNIKNACLHTTLIALRDLDDFFIERDLTKLKPKEKDGIWALTFGYGGSHAFLTQTERTKINKLVAHTTTLGVELRGVRWEILELVTKGVSQCLEFLKWIENEYGLGHFDLYTAAFVIRRNAEKLLTFIQSKAEERRNNRS